MTENNDDLNRQNAYVCLYKLIRQGHDNDKGLPTVKREMQLHVRVFFILTLEYFAVHVVIWWQRDYPAGCPVTAPITGRSTLLTNSETAGPRCVGLASGRTPSHIGQVS